MATAVPRCATSIAVARPRPVAPPVPIAAPVCTYAVGYRFYSRFLASSVFGLDDRRATPAERFNNGRDFVPTNRWVLYGHHFAAIAGAGPLVGPVLAAQFGFLPGTLWLLMGGGSAPARTRVHALRHGAHLDDGRLRVRRVGAPGVDAALPAGLSVHLPQDHDDRRARARDPSDPAPAQDARAHALRAVGGGTGVRGEAVPVRLHHDRVRGDLGVPRARRLGHDAQDDCPPARRPPHRLRRDAD